MSLPNDWRDIISKLVKLNNNNAVRIILTGILVAATPYYIWNERNKRLFDKGKRDVETMTEMIVEHVKLKLMSMRVKYFVQLRNLERE